ncbi:hypothetical protein [Actinomadura sp. WMMB 499]|uniref:hypothetical protein n=1 Tax=Actinomadura sp. WMMB 499 TaxID=1219491 RepID=UPI0012494518|nr:hypothetical protein [Actinomadura sp. WMMB 499]QFG24047.1 hypothetical protein F7P10_25905 [Actinomadura sp. WMMB 499]
MHRIARAFAAIALLLPVTAAGCAQQSAPEVRPTAAMPTPSPPEPVELTPEVAKETFRTYVVNEDVARAAGDERLALTWTSDGQSQLTAAEFRKAAYDGDPVRRFDYGKPELYVPKLQQGGYPQWFVASVDRSVVGETDGARRVLMSFILRGADRRWSLTNAVVVDRDADLPAVAIDDEGYAEALSSDDTSVLIRPQEMGGIHATMAAEGEGSVAAKVMEAGTRTSGYYERAEKAKERAAEDDLTLTVVPTATSFPYFGLRTEDGGGLIIYSLYRNTSLISEAAADDPEAPRPEIPGDAEHLLDGTVEGNKVDTASTLHFAAYDPPRADGEGGEGGADGEGDGEGDGEPSPSASPDGERRTEENRESGDGGSGESGAVKARVVGDGGAVTRAATPPLKKN